MNDLSWIAAEYHFPSTYSIRVPGSSMTNVKAMPAPGPGTVRLAMIRVGIELFGIDQIREILFPHIRSSELRVSPPEGVSLSTHLIRVYKPIDRDGKIHYQEGIAVREFAHAKGNLTIFIKAPDEHLDTMKNVLENIGYWGQANSLAYCVGISSQEPSETSCGMPVEQFENTGVNYFTCFVSEFVSKELAWADIVPESSKKHKDPLKYLLYVWPLVILERRNGHTLLHRHAEGADVNFGV